jgi:hypothetical protein
MFNPFREVNWRPSLAERGTFGWSLVIGFPSLAAALLLAAFYLLIVTPIGAAMRAFGRKAISKTFDGNIRSYWVDVEKTDDVKDYYRQY